MPFVALRIQFASLAQQESTQEEDARICAHVSHAVAHLLNQTQKVSTWITVARLEKAPQEYLRVTLSGEHALADAQEVLSALAVHPLLACEGVSYRVLSVGLAYALGAAVSSWADVLAPPPRRPLRLRFVTPLLVTGSSEDATRVDCFPQPWLMFGAVFDRWRHLGGPMLSEQLLSWLRDRGCVVSEYHLQGVPIPVKSAEGASTMTVGWTGWITYSCRETDAAHMTDIWALARFATFVGMGDQTEYGFGVTQVVEQGKEHPWTGASSK